MDPWHTFVSNTPPHQASKTNGCQAPCSWTDSRLAVFKVTYSSSLRAFRHMKPMQLKKGRLMSGKMMAHMPIPQLSALLASLPLPPRR